MYSVNGKGAGTVSGRAKHGGPSKLWFNRIPAQSTPLQDEGEVKLMGTLPLVGMMFFCVCGGPFGMESVS
jgi:hypothetical protein